MRVLFLDGCVFVFYHEGREGYEGHEEKTVIFNVSSNRPSEWIIDHSAASQIAEQ